MANLAGFDANTVEPRAEMGPIPAGKYLAIIEESEMKDTQAGTGEYLALTFQVIEGEFKGRKVWDNLNLKNPNSDTVEIAKSTLSSICRACGVMTPKESAELHDKPIIISVGLEAKKDRDKNIIPGEFRNKIRGYSKKEEAEFQQGNDSDIPF